MKVGGKSENIAKLIVVLAMVLLGWTSTTNSLFTLEADWVGFNATWICFHVVSEPLIVVVLEAKVCPVDDRRAMVSFTGEAETEGKR